MANRLRFQFLALAPGVLALAGYFRDSFRIGTGFAAVCLPLREYAVASGMCAFRRCSHGNSFCHACPSLRKKRVGSRNGVSALSECQVLPSGAHLSSPTMQHRTRGKNTLSRFAHHGQISGRQEHSGRCHHHHAESEPAKTTQKWRVRPLTHPLVHIALTSTTWPWDS